MNMKQFIIAALMLLAVGVNAQRVFVYGSDADTLTTSSSIDTVDFWLGGSSFATAERFRGDGYLAVHLVSDSLSGATQAVATIDHFYGNVATAVPYAAETFSNINGATQQSQLKEETQLGAYVVRVRVISRASNGSAGNGTQSTRLRLNWIYKDN